MLPVVARLAAGAGEREQAAGQQDDADALGEDSEDARKGPVESFTCDGLLSELRALDDVDHFFHAPGDGGPFDFHLAQIVAIGLVGLDAHHAGAFQATQERGVDVADGFAKISGRGLDARAFKQALHVGLHLARQRRGRVIRGGLGRVGGDQIFLGLAVEEVANQGKDQQSHAEPEQKPQEQAHGQAQLGQVEGERFVQVELVGQSVVLAGLAQLRAGLRVLARAGTHLAPLLFARGQRVVAIMTELEFAVGQDVVHGPRWLGRRWLRRLGACRRRQRSHSECERQRAQAHEAILR